MALLQGVMVGGVYALVALGMVVVYKSSKVLNLAHGGILMFLAYFCTIVFTSIGLPLAASLVLTLLLAIVVGIGLERFCLRPLIAQPIEATIILTLVLGFFFHGLVLLCWGGRGMALPLITGESIRIGGTAIAPAYIYSFIIAIVLFIALALFFRYTKLGLSMRAVAEDHKVSQSLGIRVKRVFSISWIICCLTAAVGGMLLGSIWIVESSMSIVGLAKALPVILLGGLESFAGALFGGLIVGIVEIVAGTYLYTWSGFSDVCPFILMLLILLFRPYGLFGLVRIERI